MTDTRLESRLLLVPLTARDAANTCDLLGREGIDCLVCESTQALSEAIRQGAGAIMLAEEMIAADRGALQRAVAGQPLWSDLPIIVLSRGGQDSPAALKAMQTLGNVIILERPVRMSTLITAVRTALRDRARQYRTRRHLAQLEDSDRRKNEFLAMLAHELRNPLAPIRTAMQVIERSSDEERRRWAREVVDRQVVHLTRLVDDLLDVSRITRGKVRLQKEAVSLDSIIGRAIETSRPLMDARNQELTVAMPDEPVTLVGDLTRLVQAVSNLLNNASKYTSDGGKIRIDAEHAASSVSIRVSDTGIGIPAHAVSGIFELFAQVDTSLDRAHGGLGIGLTLVRSIAQLHGGTVHAHSDGEGRGSTFTLTLPTSEPERLQAKPTNGARTTLPAASRRVLIVDDNADAGDSLALLLRAMGYETETAASGMRALQRLDVFQPDAVVLDISLPGMDGYEVARSIRGLPIGRDLLLIALTGYGGEEVRERARSAGFDHHVTKPADFEKLNALLASPRRQTA
jgi:signal transduction histidine kinase/ActR/RegA family two-component response regulator